MALSTDLMSERSRYYTFKDQVSNLASELLVSYNNLYKVSQHIKETYQVNNDSGDRGKFKISCNALKSKYDLLVNSTIPAINNKIDELDSQINTALAEEEKALEETELNDSTSSNRKLDDLLRNKLEDSNERIL